MLSAEEWKVPHVQRPWGRGWASLVNNKEPGVPKHVGSGSVWPCPQGPFSLEGRDVSLGLQPVIDAGTDFPAGTGPVCLRQFVLLWRSILCARHSTVLTCMISPGFIEGRAEALAQDHPAGTGVA